MSSIQLLEQHLNSLENYISSADQKNLKVSKASISWQLNHSLIVINSIIKIMQQSDLNTKTKLTLIGRFCLFFNYIPRGKGKAPKAVNPKEDISKKELTEKLKGTRRDIALLEELDSKSNFKHLYFGTLNKKTTIKFLNMHTKHHLKIVRDILK